MLSSLITLFAAPDNCTKGFLGLKPWYEYLPDSRFEGCDIRSFKLFPPDSDVPLVLLAVVDDLLRIAGLVALAFVIYGGVNYITSQGNPEDAARAQSTMLNALIGLATAVVAVAFVTFIGSTLD